MLWLIQVSVVSLIIIYVMHNLYSFFKDTLTVPKIKDMVKRPQQRYDALFRELRNQVAEQANANDNANANANASSEADNMKNELKRYLMDLNSSHTTQEPQPQSDFVGMGSIYK
jgi:DNA-binding ferritin-like protein